MDVWVVVKIGCLECDGRSELAGVFSNAEVAQAKRDEIAAGTHSTDRDVVLFRATVDAGEGEPVGESVWSPNWLPDDRYHAS